MTPKETKRLDELRGMLDMDQRLNPEELVEHSVLMFKALEDGMNTGAKIVHLIEQDNARQA